MWSYIYTTQLTPSNHSVTIFTPLSSLLQTLQWPYLRHSAHSFKPFSDHIYTTQLTPSNPSVTIYYVTYALSFKSSKSIWPSQVTKLLYFSFVFSKSGCSLPTPLPRVISLCVKFYVVMVRITSHSFAAFTREIFFLPLEHEKIIHKILLPGTRHNSIISQKIRSI